MEKHMKYCISGQKVEMPKDDTIKFRHYNNINECPIRIYGDFETLNDVSMKHKSKNGNTIFKTGHKPASFEIIVVSDIYIEGYTKVGDYYITTYKNEGLDSANVFINKISQLEAGRDVYGLNVWGLAFRVYIKTVYARRGGGISWYLKRGVGLVLDVQELGFLELNLGFKPYEIKGRHDLLDRGCGGWRIQLVLEANTARSRLLSVLLLELGFSPHLIELLDDVIGSLEGRHDHLDQNAVEVWVAGRVVFSRERGCGGWRRVLEVLKARSLVLVHRGTQHRKSVVDVEIGRRYSLLRADRYAGHVKGEAEWGRGVERECLNFMYRAIFFVYIILLVLCTNYRLLRGKIFRVFMTKGFRV